MSDSNSQSGSSVGQPKLATWGLVATVLAPAGDILRFAAYHLEKGAAQIHLYLDAACPEVMPFLQGHPKIRVTLCDDAYWTERKGRPEAHQPRQTKNATHAYYRSGKIDWLIHMDVDEFLVSDRNIADVLAPIPEDTLVARVRPMEQLSGGAGNAFKYFIPTSPERSRTVRALYPTYGPYLKGGFLSHLGGKVFVRPGQKKAQFRIHNFIQEGEVIKGIDHLMGVDLAHCHAKTWDAWYASYRYRLEKGSYRSDLGPNKSRVFGGMNLHELFTDIEAKDGKAGLRAFFDEVCADTPELRARLSQFNLLREVNLDLNATLSTHFPNWRG